MRNEPKHKKAYDQIYYAANKERIKAQVRAYAAANKEKIAASKKAFRAAHKEECRARSRAFYEAHREERIAYQKALHASKPDAIKTYKKQWWIEGRTDYLAKKFKHYHENRGAISEKQKAAYKTNPLPFKAYTAQRRALKRETQVEKVNLFEVLRDSKGICGICKKPLDLFGIHFDHIIPLARGGTHTRETFRRHTLAAI